MRVWVIFLLILSISLAIVATKAPKSIKKDAHKGTDDLPPLGDGDNEDLDSKEEEENVEKPVTKPTRKSLKKGRSESDDSAQISQDPAAAGRLEEIQAKLCSQIEQACQEKDDENEENSKDAKSGKKKPSDDEDDDDVNLVCDEQNHMCICNAEELDCHAEEDEEKMKNADIVIKRKGVKVKVANFRGNALTALKKELVLPRREEEVEELIFSKNKISKIEKGVFNSFTKLKKLSLDDNKISSLSPEQLKGLSGLHQLNLKNNKLTTLPDGIFKGLPNLTKLILDGNELELTKEKFEGLSELEELSLDNCKLTTKLPSNLFDHLDNLKKLSLRGNPLIDVPIALKALKSLEHLDISETDIPELHEMSFHDDLDLNSLRIENMQYLYAIHDKAFCGLTNLEKLYMSNNTKLYDIHEGAFGMNVESSKVVSLKIIDLSNCNLTTLPEDLLYYDGVTTLTIGGNPFNCSCETAFLLGERTYEFEYGSPMPKCNSPEKYKGHSFLKVQGTEVCPALNQSRKIWRGTRVLSVLLLLTAAMLAGIVLYSKGYFQRFYKSNRNGAPAFPSMTYSNLTNQDDGRSLEADFQPRPEDV